MLASIVTLLLAALAVPAPPPAGAGVSDASALAWMAGSWGGSKDGVENEEVWTAPRGGTLLGIHRDVAGGKTVEFEFLRIEAGPNGIIYWASPNGRPATPFRMIELAKDRVVFENAQHDFPSRVLYWTGADGLLHARVEGTLKGQAASEEWSWRRVP